MEYRRQVVSRVICLVAAGAVGVLMTGAPTQAVWAQSADQDLPAETTSNSQSRREQRQNRRQERQDNRDPGGVAVGALAGAALGAVYGEAGAGAAAGAIAGGMYEYDQRRQDDRTQMLADSIAASQQQEAANTPSTPQPAAQPQQTVGDVGRQHMQDFVGDWIFEFWVLTADGSRLPGSGTARGMSAGENAARVLFTEVNAAAFPDNTGGGHVLLSYKPGQGFFLESATAAGEPLNLVGEYVANENKYVFYLIGGGGDELAGGIIKSSARVEIRSSGASTWSAETSSYVDGKETVVQSYRFVRQ